MTTRLLIFVPLLLALSACSGEETGHKPGTGGTGGPPEADCTQLECLEGDDSYYKVDKLCLPGGCTDASRRNEVGEHLRGEMLIGVNTEYGDARNMASAYLRIFHPVDIYGEAVDCKRIFETPDRLDEALNVVGYYTTLVNSWGYHDFNGIFGPVPYLPVNDTSNPYVVHVAFFSGPRDTFTKHPTGVMRAEGCKEGMVVAEGAIENPQEPDAAHTFNVVANRGP